MADANASVVSNDGSRVISPVNTPEGTIKSGKAGFQKKNSSVLGDLLGRHKRGTSMSDNFDGVLSKSLIKACTQETNLEQLMSL